MLLTITTTHPPATDLGYLLHKNPSRVQSFEQSFGKATVFYPEVSETRCTAALLLEVDPVGLVRGRREGGGEGGLFEQYVNDRPYVASSFLSVALASVYGTALSGICKQRPELVCTPLPLEARVAALPCRGSEGVLCRLFEPLGYEVEAEGFPLDSTRPEWGESPYFSVTLRGTQLLSDLLSHLYVLIPVLDAQKHYWIGDQEVEKLLRHGEGWLASHPERDLIAQRYLRRRVGLVREALARLEEEDAPAKEAKEEQHDREEERVEERVSLNRQRLDAVADAIRRSGARRVLDLGCGEGKLLRRLLDDRALQEVVGLDVSARTLELAARKLGLDRMPERERARLQLLHGSLVYRDRRLEGYDAAAVVEVIEHLEPHRLAAFEGAVFGHARPGTVVVTTPNAEYNRLWASLPAGRFRHHDHRFEWSREQFRTWAAAIGERFGYAVTLSPVGPEDPGAGAPTQMAVFSRHAA